MTFIMSGFSDSDNLSNIVESQDNTFNKSLEEFLNEKLGPKHLPLTSLVPLTVIFSLLFITGVLGNISVCAVIIRNPSMHTATNYYLFSLAVSDLNLLILGLPNDLSVYWQQYPFVFGEGICKFRAFLSEMVSYTSVLTIVAFSMERYLAICHPLHHYSMSGLKRAIKIIGFVWAVSMASAVPFAIYTKINYVDYPPGSGRRANESAFCGMLASNIPPHLPIYEMSSFFFFFLPMIVILMLYIKMGIHIRQRGDGKSLSLEGSVHERRHSSSRKSIIRMLTAVVVAFFLFWAPFHAQRLLYIYLGDQPNYQVINEWIFHITGILYYVSSTANPILYSVMSAKYRRAFRQILCGFVSTKEPASPERTNHSDDYAPHRRLSDGIRGSIATRSRFYKIKTSTKQNERQTEFESEGVSENSNLIARVEMNSLIQEEDTRLKSPSSLVMVITPSPEQFSIVNKGTMWPKTLLWVVRSKTISAPEMIREGCDATNHERKDKSNESHVIFKVRKSTYQYGESSI